MLLISPPIRTPRLYFKDADGKPLIGGKVYSFKADYEDRFNPTYRDTYRNAFNQNPILLDNAGSAFIYAFSSTRLEVYDKNGNWIERRFIPVTEDYAIFYDRYGYPLKNGKVWTYDVASTIKKPSYQDANQTILNPNPVVLDENGGAAICIAGAYRLRIYDEKGVFITDQDFKQENRFVLTSLTYPLLTIEAISTSNLDFNANERLILNTSDLPENIQTSTSIDYAVMRDPLLNSIALLESMNTAAAFSGAQITGGTSYLSTGMRIESVTTSAGFASAQITHTVVYLTTTIEPQSISTTCTFSGAQITN